MRKFNLLEEPWIPVRKGGTVREVGLEEALVEASRIAGVESASPLEEAVLHRLLLAVLYGALPRVKDQEDVLDLMDRGGFDRESLTAYFERVRFRFFLFHEEAPFLQVPDLPDQDPLPWSKLLSELASGNNPTLFDHTTVQNVPRASYAQAARALLVHQSYAPGGLLKRLGVISAKDAPLARPAAFLVTGENLFQTLVLNLVPQQAPGAPVWEGPPLTMVHVAGRATQWPLEGVARVYAWPSRGVRLLDEGGGVRWIAYGPGVEPLEVGFRDPMVAYRLNRQDQILPLRLSVEQSFWRDFGAMLPAAGGTYPAVLSQAVQIAEEHGIPTRLRVLGQVSDQAKVLDIRREVYPLPRGLLTPKGEVLLQTGLEEAEVLGRHLGAVATALAQGMLGDTDRNQLENFAKGLPLLRLYWAELDGAFPRFLGALPGPEALDGWRKDVKGAALRAWDETRRFVGTQGRHLRALAAGERAFGRALGAHGKEVVR